MPRNVVQMERDPFGPPVAGSLLLHLAITGTLVLYIWLAGRHGAEWGNNAPPGAIQATMVSSAPSIPLPQDTPPTPNVLATQTPSPAPAPPAPKVQPVPVPDAIPIAEKQHHRVKLKDKKLQTASPPHAQPVPNQRHRVNYGEAQATQIPHATTGNPTPASPVNVNGGDFASKFPWYVTLITRKVSEAWYRQEIDPGTAYGSQVRVVFTISRDGSVHDIHSSQPSSSPTLNSSALRAVQRVDSFGPLPNQYTGSTVTVEYTFTYDQPSH